jgi:nitric oxide reductase subunit B
MRASVPVLRNGLIAVMVVMFSSLLLGGAWVYRNRAPIPERVIDEKGSVITTAAEIQRGQELFRQTNLMDFGSVLGHGAYLGPDFTAQALKLWTHAIRDELARERWGRTFAQLKTEARDTIAAATIWELKVNSYSPQTGILGLSGPFARALRSVQQHYVDYFRHGDIRRAMPAALYEKATDGDLVAMSNFLWWTAWLSVTPRPEESTTYSNNWPPAPESGNVLSRGALLWSAVSLVGLLFALALLFAFYRSPLSEEPKGPARWILERDPTPSQLALGKYFVVAGLLFLVQVALGALMAHQYVTGSDFYGIDLGKWLPFQLIRGWHLQLAVLWIAMAWVGLGLFLAPVLAGRETSGQAMGVNLLFASLVVLVVGALSGLYLSVHGKLGTWWWWLGTQGWEYLELGRIWQGVLAVGLTLWLVLIVRALGRTISQPDDTGGLSRLFLATTTAIPGFYLFAFLLSKGSHITVADYWRWWIIHLWVEGIFEVFAVVVTGTLLVRMGLADAKNALKALYLQLILLMGSGILGTGHHYYWIGAPEFWIAAGAVFSALEVVPLTLLMAEAVDHYRSSQTPTRSGPYGETFLYLAAAAFWNVVGAGLLGFLINLPVVNYYEHGTFLTATHGHGALMGVYGFLAIAVMLFAMRHIVAVGEWPAGYFRVAFFGLNIGLFGMLVVTLLPVGFLQLSAVMDSGYDAARSLAFYRTPLVAKLLWLRIIPDSIFIFLGVVPLVAGLIHAWRKPFKPEVSET